MWNQGQWRDGSQNLQRNLKVSSLKKQHWKVLKRHEIPNHKHQITKISQISIHNEQNIIDVFRI